ncbi:MAG: OmpP1/FadL family transporter [Zoogloeaceae bacterium]|jgi:long-chain fatty acid transport protein|nr:OmpP1/FadL family transporter [Zoogloeaceae bacterium]
MKKSISILPLAAVVAAVFAMPVSADGFQSVEQNASGLGVAYAGAAAVADNASTVYYNPAGLVQLPGAQISLGLVGALQRYEFDNDGSIGLAGGDGGQAGQWRSLPNAYFSWAVNPDLSFGLGISSPYSLDLDYDNDWLGRDAGIEARISSLNINPAIAYRLSDKISLGFGLDYQTLKLKTSLASTSDSDSDSDWGWNAGALFTLSPDMRVGVAYRSGMKFRLDARPSALTAFPGVDGSGRFKTPGRFSLSVWQQVSDKWEAMGDISYVHWKRLDDYDHDSWRLSWGAAYTYNERWKSKFGLAYDRSPVRLSDRTALLPDAHRIWFSLGGQYRFSKYSALDFGYAYQWVKTPRLNESLGSGVRLRGDYDASGHIIGVQYTQGF